MFEFSNPDIWPDIESLSSYLVCGIELRYADFVYLAFPLYRLTPVCNDSTIPSNILSSVGSLLKVHLPHDLGCDKMGLFLLLYMPT